MPDSGAYMAPTKNFPFPDLALSQHIAVLGKTGAGKTSTVKLIVEHQVAEDYRVCILDPLKSDYWGLTSSANGKQAGLPFTILGGPHGHIPLPPKSGKIIGELVATGKLPLSILDMKRFRPGEHQAFFNAFAEALLNKIRGVVYLVIEEAHFFAPKERSGISGENMAVYWAKMLATSGRSAGIRLIMATQRTQALHNALLGSCDTIVAQRLTAPADQKPVQDWLKANVKDKEIITQISDGMSSLKTGQGWLCSGEAQVFQLVQFPRIKTFDNTTTPEKDGSRVQVKTAKVDQDALKALIGDAVEEIEANDPEALKAQLAKLKGQLAIQQTGEKLLKANLDKAVEIAQNQPDKAALESAAIKGFEQGQTAMRAHLRGQLEKKIEALIENAQKTLAALNEIASRAHASAAKTQQDIEQLTDSLAFLERAAPYKFEGSPQKAFIEHVAPITGLTTISQLGMVNDSSLTPYQLSLLEACAFWRAMDISNPTRFQVAFAASVSPKSSTFDKYLSVLKSGGYLTAPAAGRLALTDLGAQTAPAIKGGSFRDRIATVLTPQQLKLLDAVPTDGTISRDDLARAAEMSPTSSTFEKYVSVLRSLQLIHSPERGVVALVGWE